MKQNSTSAAESQWKRLKTFLSLSFITLFSLQGAGKGLVDYVNPLVGTQSTYELSAGNTYPAIAMPWGMNF